MKASDLLKNETAAPSGLLREDRGSRVSLKREAGSKAAGLLRESHPSLGGTPRPEESAHARPARQSERSEAVKRSRAASAVRRAASIAAAAAIEDGSRDRDDADELAHEAGERSAMAVQAVRAHGPAKNVAGQAASEGARSAEAAGEPAGRDNQEDGHAAQSQPAPAAEAENAARTQHDPGRALPNAIPKEGHARPGAEARWARYEEAAKAEIEAARTEAAGGARPASAPSAPPETPGPAPEPRARRRALSDKVRKAAVKRGAARQAAFSARAASHGGSAVPGAGFAPSKGRFRAHRAIRTGKATAAGAAGAAGGALPFLLAFVLLFAFVGIASAQSDRYNLSGLTPTERTVAQFLFDKGLDKVHVAAVMGNLSAESGFQAGAVEGGSGIGHGIAQWSYGRWNTLQSYAASVGKEWSDVQVQTDLLWYEYAGEPGKLGNPGASGASVQWGWSPTANSQAFRSAKGYGAASREDFERTAALADAVLYFCYAHERPAQGLERNEVRISEAQRYLAVFNLGATNLAGSAIIEAASTQLGVPYVWGGTTPGVSLDCSGLTQWAYAQAGLQLPRTTYEQIKCCTIVPESEAVPGDLVFMEFSAPGVPEHVGIYVGDGMMINAESGSTMKVVLSPIWASDAQFGRLDG